MSGNAAELAHVLRTRLKVKQLAVLCAIAEQGSLHRAAAAQGMSQPAMSKILKEIENAVGTPLFERSAGGLQATRFGERLIFSARALLTDLDQLALELVAIREGYQAALRIGVIPLLSSALLASVIETLGAAGRNYAFNVRFGSTDILVAALRSHELDCVLGRFPGTSYPDDLDCRPLYTQNPVVAASARSALRHHEGPLRLPDLKGFRWVLPSHSTPVRKAIDRFFQTADGMLTQPAVECIDPRLIRFLLARQHDLVALLPQEIAEEISEHSELVYFPIEMEFSYPAVCLIKLRRAQDDPALGHFTRALEQAVEAAAAG